MENGLNWLRMVGNRPWVCTATVPQVESDGAEIDVGLWSERKR